MSERNASHCDESEHGESMANPGFVPLSVLELACKARDAAREAHAEILAEVERLRSALEKNAGVPAREWTDDDGDPLGAWVTVEEKEWRSILAAHGGTEALSVFSTLTDPDGVYGEPRVYTAWGRREDDAPLVDICDFKDPERRVLRKFVRTPEL